MDQGSIAFRGVRSTYDFDSSLYENDWRAGIARLSPNVDTPLAFLASLSNKDKATGPIYDWFSEKDYMGVLSITGLYTNVGLSSAYNPTQQSECVSAGDVLYIKCSEDDAKRMSQNHHIRMSETNLRVDLQADVLSVVLAGTSSYIVAKMLQADTYVEGGKDLSDATYVTDLGMAAPEYDTWGDPKARDPEHYTNYTQIFHKSIAVTGTQMASSIYKHEDPYQKAKMDAAFDINRDLERAFLFGIKSATIGHNGKPRRSTAGVCRWIADYASTNVRDFRTDTFISSGTWAANGLNWMEDVMESVFQWGSDTRMGLVGGGTLRAINQAVHSSTTYNIYHNEQAYGINVSILEGPFGRLALHRHQLFTTNPVDNNRMVIVDPGNLGIRDLRDLQYKQDLTKELGASAAVDGIKEGYIAETGTLFDHPETMADLRGFGFDHD